MRFLPLLLIPLALTACKEEEAKAPPPPVELTTEALSYFCQMNVAEHGGPKGQVHLAGYPAPIFFAQVRDMVAYVKGPERDAEITAIYVSDMGAAESWRYPGQDNWILAEDAQFIVGASVAGGMGAPEIVPFAKAEEAQPFLERHGGSLMSLAEIPEETVLGPVDLSQVLDTPS
jgi:copper chaperone NosL